MRTLRYALALITTTSVVALGCAASDDQNPFTGDISTDLDLQAGGTCYEPPSGRNGLKPAHFWSETAQTAYRDMQNQSLKDGTTFVAGVEVPVLRAPTGSPLRNLITAYPEAAVDLIECALDNTQSVYDVTTGIEIRGWFGLAPSWMDSPINTMIDEQEWLTACMLGRLNYWGITVNILLEGDTPAIQTNSVWDPRMPYNESTLYGNMFNSTKPITGNTPAFHAYLCRENYLASVCPADGGAAYMMKRICDNAPNICGLIDAGLCDPVAPGSLGACVAGSTTEHWKCKKGAAATVFELRTVGVQLENPIKAGACN